MTAVEPEALAVSRSPPAARARTVGERKMGEVYPTDPLFRPALGQGQRKAGSDRTRGRHKRVRADQTLVAP